MNDQFTLTAAVKFYNIDVKELYAAIAKRTVVVLGYTKEGEPIIQNDKQLKKLSRPI